MDAVLRIIFLIIILDKNFWRNCAVNSSVKETPSRSEKKMSRMKVLNAFVLWIQLQS